MHLTGRPVGSCLSALAFALTLLSLAGPARADKTPADGDLLFIGNPIATPTQYFLLRAKVPSGVVDTLASLPAGNVPRGIAVSPFGGLVYILGTTNMMVVDPCTGVVGTLPTGAAFINDQLWVHSNGSIYWSRGSDGKIYRVDRQTGSFTTIANLLTSYGVGGGGIVEGSDHQLYVATANGSSGVHPWVVRVDPITGASAVVASFDIQSGNVRALAFDTRDSLYVLRVGFNQIVHRADRITGAVSQYVTLPFIGTTIGSMAAHPDGGLYVPGAAVAAQYSIVRLNPVTGVVTTLVPQQPVMGYFSMAVMRGFGGCPTEVHKSTWGQLKTLYR